MGKSQGNIVIVQGELCASLSPLETDARILLLYQSFIFSQRCPLRSSPHVQKLDSFIKHRTTEVLPGDGTALKVGMTQQIS